MADQGFAVPGSSYKELIKIIQGYAQVGKEAVPAEVGSLIGMHPTQVSRSNKFLVAVGIVQGGQKKRITPLGADLARALQHNMEHEIANKWREIAEGNDFLQKVVAAVRIRKSMDESSLEAHVAYSAGQPKTAPVMAGAGTIVEILKLSGLLVEDGGSLVAVSPLDSRPDTVRTEPEIYPAPEVSPAPPESVPIPHVLSVPAVPGTPINVSIQIRVTCTAAELDGLGPRLRKIFDEFTAATDTPTPYEEQDPEESAQD